MANILFGGPYEIDRHNPVHDDLVARLKKEGHNVDYVGDPIQMIAGMSVGQIYRTTDLVLCDTGLFYPNAAEDKKIELFNDDVLRYLACAKTSVIVLADKKFAEKIASPVYQAGFEQIDLPYDIDDVFRRINPYLTKP